MKERYSTLEQTMEMFRDAQYAPMIVIKDIRDACVSTEATFHHLFVCNGSHQWLKYTFLVYWKDGYPHDHLLNVRIVTETLDDLIVECTHAVLHDGKAVMSIYP